MIVMIMMMMMMMMMMMIMIMMMMMMMMMLHGMTWPPSIGATIVGTGEDWSLHLLGWGPAMYWSPSFLAIVFKKQKNSQQVVTRMQPLATEFSQIFRGNNFRTVTAGGGAPPRIQHPVRPLAGRGAQVPRCWDPNFAPPPPNFSAVVAPPR